MNHREDFPPPFRLGPWLVQPDLNRISNDDGHNPVEPRVMQVLLCLSKSPDEVWSRQALLDEVWADAEVGEEILTRAISELRRVFGDKARDPRFIETIRNHGYRLIVKPELVAREPQPIETTAVASTIKAESDPVETSSPEPEIMVDAGPVVFQDPVKVTEIANPVQSGGNSFSPFKHVFLPMGGLLFLVFALYVGQNLMNRNKVTSSSYSDTIAARPLTSFPGREWHPAFSADGTRVAFVWSNPDDPEGSAANIYVKQQNSETLLQLTDNSDWVAWPAWSPDGQTIAFVQGGSTGSTLSLVSSLGGAVRGVHTVSSWIEGLDFSPHGKSLLFAARAEKTGKYGIYELNLQTLQVEKLSLDDGQRAGDFQPRYSPDGGSVAWVGVGLSGHSSLYFASLDKDGVQKIGSDLANLQGLAFAADGHHLIYSASPAGTFNLWRIALQAGSNQSAELLPTPGTFAWNPNVARQSGDLVFEQVQVDQDIWRISIKEKDPWQLETSGFLKSTRWEYEADFSPNGNDVAFISSRSGSPEVWLSDNEGQNLRKLTNLGSSGLTNLRWAPGGGHLAFNMLKLGHSVVMVMDIRGAEPRIITADGQNELFSAWSHDGKSLLYGSAQENSWELRRRNLEDGKSSTVSTVAVVSAIESADGQSLYYTMPNQPGLWKQALNKQGQVHGTDKPRLVLDGLANQDIHNWVLNEEEIFWVMRMGDVPMLAVTDLASGRVSLLTELSGMTGNGLAVSPDGKSVLYPRTGKMAGDLMVLQGLK